VKAACCKTLQDVSSLSFTIGEHLFSSQRVPSPGGRRWRDAPDEGSLHPRSALLTWNHTETIMVAVEVQVMTTTLTLKNIPDNVYNRLKRSATLHRRSLNSEAIVCLEAVLVPSSVTPGERLARARRLRAELGTATFEASDIDTYKRQDRP
jgi:plasmid stability protein